MADQREQVTDREAREAWLSAAAQLGMANRPVPDVMRVLTERLQERDHLHQVVADVAEAGGVSRQAPIRDLTNRVAELTGQAPVPRQLEEIAEVKPGTPAREVLDRIRQMVADRTALVSALRDVKDALGVPLEATQDTLLDRIADLRVAQDQAAENTIRGGVAFSGRLRQVLGLRQETTHQQIMDRVAELKLQTKTAVLLADALAQPRDTPVKDLLEIVAGQRAESEQVGLLRELAHEVRAALELPATSTNRAVLNRIGHLQATRAQYADTERNLREGAAGIFAELRARLALPEEAGWPEILEAVEAAARPHVITVEEVERQHAERLGAIGRVLELWREHHLGEVPAVDDMVALAEYLVTGDTSTAIRAQEAAMERAQRYQQTQSVDGARWTPGDSTGG